MPLRFQKRLKLLKGLTLNLSKGGASVTVGKKGAGINIGKNGVTGNAGIPGTGISYREKLSGKPLASLAQPLFWLLLIALIGFVLGGGSLDAVLKNLLTLIQP